MAEEYPYMVSNNKIGPIFEQIEKAEKPQRFSNEFLKKIGFSSSNDRAIIPLLKRLGILQENGAPTEHYDDLKDKLKRPYALADRIRDLYNELYSINTNIHAASDDEIKGAISRVTGKDAKTVTRYFATLKALINLANFTGTIPIKIDIIKKDEKNTEGDKALLKDKEEQPLDGVDFHYNIQIHLPATTDISVYNAIFKSLKENLLGK